MSASEMIRLMEALAETIQSLPRQVGQLAVNFSKERFVEQNWLDESPEPWQPRKRKRRGGKARQQGAILVDSGRLKRSIRIIRVEGTSVTIGTNVPYAQKHNEGFTGTENVKAYVQRVKQHKRKMKVKSGKRLKVKNVTVKAHSRRIKAHARKVNIPKRQFLGSSRQLEEQISTFISSEIENTIKDTLQ